MLLLNKVDVVLGHDISDVTAMPAMTNHLKLENINAIPKYDKEVFKTEKEKIEIFKIILF